MKTQSTTTIDLSDDEVRLITYALESLVTDFGHDEADVLRETQRLLAKIKTVRPDANS